MVLCYLVLWCLTNSFVIQNDSLVYILQLWCAPIGLWGMNFQDMPELKQDWGYEMFWILCATSVAITIVFLYFERRHR